MNLEHLEKIISIPSPSGREDDLQKYLYSYYRNDFEKFEVGRHGALTAISNSKSDFRVLLAGHADEISLGVIGYNDDGSLKVEKNGGIRPALYVGCRVKVITDKGIIPGVMGYNSSMLEKAKLGTDDLFLDIGCSTKEEAMELVPKGSYVIHDAGFTKLQGDRLAARAFDDRIGVYIIFEAAKKAIEKGVNIGIYTCATSGEETVGRGAHEAASIYKPQICVAVDVTFANDYINPGAGGDVKLGKGGVLCKGPIPNRKLNKLIEECAEKLSLPLQYETSTERTYTDADTMIKTFTAPAQVLFSIPLRYMHSSVEVCSTSDVDGMIDILAEFLISLKEDIDLMPYTLE